MSAPAFAWAIEQGFLRDLKPSDRLLLQYLADQADVNGECFPGQERIRKYTGLALRTIRAGIPRLAAEGLIWVEERQGYVTHYRLNRATNGIDPAPPPRQNVTGDPGKMSPTTPANSYRVPGIEPRQNVTGTPANEHGGPRQMVMVTPANCSPDPLGTQGSKKGRKQDTGARASRLAMNWTPTPGCIAFAEGKGLDPDAVADEFRDYWHARAGQGACKLDWEATWRNWCRTKLERAPRHSATFRDNSRGKLAWAIDSIMSEARH